MFNRKAITRIIIVCGVLVTVPIITYTINFFNSEISNDPQSWGYFGDYIGGIVNPIIGIASLVVLGYLTVIMGKQSTEENKKLFLLQQRMLAYQDLTEHIKEINMFSNKLSQANANLTFLNLLSSNTQGQQTYQILQERNSVFFVFTKFYNTLFTFEVKYGHLFKYDFKNINYKNLLSQTKAISDYFIDRMEALHGVVDNVDNSKMKDVLNQKYYKKLALVINEIREELK